MDTEYKIIEHQDKIDFDTLSGPQVQQLQAALILWFEFLLQEDQSRFGLLGSNVIIGNELSVME